MTPISEKTHMTFDVCVWLRSILPLVLRQRNICRDTKNLLSATARHRLTARHWVLVDLSGFFPCSTSVARSEGPRPGLPTNVFMARRAGVGERGGSHVVVPATWISFTEIGFRQPPFTAAAGAWHESRSYHCTGAYSKRERQLSVCCHRHRHSLPSPSS